MDAVIDANGRFMVVCNDKDCSLVPNEGETLIQYEFSPDFDVFTQKVWNYRLVDGEMVYDPMPLPPIEPSTEDILRVLLGGE